MSFLRLYGNSFGVLSLRGKKLMGRNPKKEESRTICLSTRQPHSTPPLLTRQPHSIPPLPTCQSHSTPPLPLTMLSLLQRPRSMSRCPHPHHKKMGHLGQEKPQCVRHCTPQAIQGPTFGCLLFIIEHQV